jgi:hypothetical protein
MANELEQDKNFKKVRFYQDKILLETELNELQDIQNRRFEDHVYDSLGNVVIYGFKVDAVAASWNVSINMGRAYIDGKVVTSKGDEDSLSIVNPDDYLGDLTLYVILMPINKVHLPEEEGDKGWEYGVGEPTTYRTEESYQVVIAQEGAAIIVGGQTYAVELPTDKSSYIELARILRPESSESIDDCIVRDTRENLILKLGQLVNKKFYMKAEEDYNDTGSMKSPNELIIHPTQNIELDINGDPIIVNSSDAIDRICTIKEVCPAELTDEEGTAIFDVDGNKVTVDSITTQDVYGETLNEATVTLSGDVAEKVYVPIVGATNLLLNENPDFENGTSDPEQWIPTGAPIFDVSGYKSSEGSKAVGVFNGNLYKSENLIAVTGDSDYIITASLKADSGSSLNYQFVIEWYDSGESLISTEVKEIIIITEHKKYIALITAPSLATYAKIVLNGDGSTLNKFWVDKIEFLDNISTGTLLTNNPDFENGTSDPDGWTPTGSPEYSTDGLNSYNGNSAVKVSNENTYSSDEFISVLESNEYIVGARIKADGVEKQCRILVEWYDEYKVLISTSYENILVTSSYEHYYIRVVSPASIVKYMKITLDGDGIDNNNWFWYDSLEVYNYDESATNLISSNNPNFETGYYVVDQWSITGSPIYSTSGFDSYNIEDSYSGKGVLKVSFGNSFESYNITVIENKPYMISAYLKANDISALSYQFRVDWYNGLSFISSSTINRTVSNENFSNNSAIVTAPVGATLAKVILNGDGLNASNWFWVDKISILDVTEHDQFPIRLHYGYEYTLANLPANFAMADIVSGVSIDMAIQEILGNRYFDGSLPIASDGTNSVDRRLVDLWDELHTHRHKGLISPRLEARDIDLMNPPGVTTESTVEDHITSVGDGIADDGNPHGLSSKDIDVKSDEVPYPNEYSDDKLLPKTSIHGKVDVSIADHILEIGTGVPDSKNPHGSDSSDIDHNSETNPDNSFKTIEQALFDRVKDLHGDGVVRGLRVFPENSNYVKITDGYAYINGKRIRVGNSVIISEVLESTDTNKIFRINGVLVNDLVYVTYFDSDVYYRWIAQAYQESGMLKVDINDSNLYYNYTGINILSYNNLKWDYNEKFDMQLNSIYQQISVAALSGLNDRIDIIIINSNGAISIVKGVEDGNRRKPIVPNNSIKIAEIYVNYNSGTDPITYDDINDCRNRIDWKHGSGNSDITYSDGVTDVNTWKKLQSLETTIDFYKQLFRYSDDLGSSLSRLAVETFIDNSNIDEGNSNNVRLDDSNIYLGTDDEPLLSMDLVADWRNFGSSGGIGTWVSKTYIGDYNTVGLPNLLDTYNPDFEVGTTDPQLWVNEGSAQYTTDSYKCNKAIKVSYTNGYTTQNYITDINQNYTETSYKISAYIKAEKANSSCRFKATWYNTIDANIGESSVFVEISNSGKYDRYEAVLVAPLGAEKLKITLDGDGNDSTNWFSIDSLELIELKKLESVLLFVRDTLNGGNNQIRYYISNDGSIPTELAQPNELHTFTTVGNQLRVKIEIEPDNNKGENQPRVHSFALIWGIGEGHSHNGEDSTDILGSDINNDNLIVVGRLSISGSTNSESDVGRTTKINIEDNSRSVSDVAELLNYLKPPAPPMIGNYNNDNQELPIDPIINGPTDMRLNLSNFNFVENAYIPADAILLSGSEIVVGTEHNGVTSLDAPIDITCYIYPAYKGYIEVTVNGSLLGSLNLTTLWVDDDYTDKAILNQLPRTATEQIDYPISGGIHGEGIELTERMTYVPPQTDRPFPYYQTAKCRFVFDPSDWGTAEELGKIRIAHYTDTGKLTLISEDISPSIFNDVS